MTFRKRVCLGAISFAAFSTLALQHGGASTPEMARGDAVPAAAPAGTPHKRALIVAISQYSPTSGWSTLHSDRDVPLIRAVLTAQRFSDIQELQGPAATRQGIVDAIHRTLLEPAKPGDILVFHYSGHGQQIPDDNGDELDGYDETLVPYDAPADEKAAGPGYDGSKHLRDDQFDELMQALRRQVGPTGNVVAFIDSCFSGTPRGNPPAGASIRGGNPLGKPRFGAKPGAREKGSGLLEAGRGGRGGESGLSPYVVFSGSRPDEFDWETRDEKGESVGSLSYALSLEFARLPAGVSTYRDLYQGVRLQVAYRVRNEPQIEGDEDSKIFNGQAVTQERFLPVKEILPDGRVTIGAGTLNGLLHGSQAEVHNETARKALPDTLLTPAEILPKGLLESYLQLEHPLKEEALRRGRVFITKHSFGSLRIGAQLKGLSPETRERIVATFQKVSALKLVDADPDIVIQPMKKSPDKIEVLTAVDGYPLLEKILPSKKGFDEEIGSRLLDYARNRYLRGLNMQNDEFHVRLRMFPVRVERCQDPKQPTDRTCTVTPLDPATRKSSGGGYAWRAGEFYKLRVENESAFPAYLNILQLEADGTIQQLWPRLGSYDKTTLQSGRSQDLGPLYQFGDVEHRGTDEILLIATDQFVDFEPFVTQSTLSRGKPRGEGPFAALFDDDSVSRGVNIYYPESSVSTQAITFTVCPEKDAKCRS